MKQLLLRTLQKMIQVLSGIRNRLLQPLPGSPEAIMADRAKPWFKLNGDDTLRIEYPLNENSIVFDVGGYKGEFASVLQNKYNCHIHVFEPLPEFYQIICNKFSNNNRVIPHCFGLSDQTSNQSISLTDNRSSLFIEGTDQKTIQLKSAVDFIREHQINKVDLIKINIEGAEYALLESLIQAGLINIFENIQVQFHDFIVPNARERMTAIQQQLSSTHELTYQFDFIWENWKKK